MDKKLTVSDVRSIADGRYFRKALPQILWSLLPLMVFMLLGGLLISIGTPEQVVYTSPQGDIITVDRQVAQLTFNSVLLQPNDDGRTVLYHVGFGIALVALLVWVVFLGYHVFQAGQEKDRLSDEWFRAEGDA